MLSVKLRESHGLTMSEFKAFSIRTFYMYTVHMNGGYKIGVGGAAGGGGGVPGPPPSPK